MDFGSAAPNIHIPLHVKPVQSKKGSVTETKVKGNDNSEASQIGDLSFRV